MQDILGFLHEQRKVLQPVRQVRWFTSWQALGIESHSREWDSKVLHQVAIPFHVAGEWLGLCKWPASTQVLDNANASDGSVMHYLLGACVQVCLPWRTMQYALHLWCQPDQKCTFCTQTSLCHEVSGLWVRPLLVWPTGQQICTLLPVGLPKKVRCCVTSFQTVIWKQSWYGIFGQGIINLPDNEISLILPYFCRSCH